MATTQIKFKQLKLDSTVLSGTNGELGIITGSAVAGVAKEQLRWEASGDVTKGYLFGSSTGHASTPQAVSNVLFQKTVFDGSSSTELASASAIKTYVDAVAQGLDIKDSVRYATNVSGGEGAYNASAGTLTRSGVGTRNIDGQPVIAGDRILVQGQSQPSMLSLEMLAAGIPANGSSIKFQAAEDDGSAANNFFQFNFDNTVANGSSTVFNASGNGATGTPFVATIGVQSLSNDAAGRKSILDKMNLALLGANGLQRASGIGSNPTVIQHDNTKMDGIAIDKLSILVGDGSAALNFNATVTLAGTHNFVANVTDREAGAASGTKSILNGLYTVTTVGAGGAIQVLTRATDADGEKLNGDGAEAGPGTFVFVESGDNHADAGFVISSDDVISANNANPVKWAQFSGAGSITAGDGLAKSGNTLSVNVDDAGIEINADTLRLVDAGVTSGKLAADSVPSGKIKSLRFSAAVAVGGSNGNNKAILSGASQFAKLPALGSDEPTLMVFLNGVLLQESADEANVGTNGDFYLKDGGSGAIHAVIDVDICDVGDLCELRFVEVA